MKNLFIALCYLLITVLLTGCSVIQEEDFPVSLEFPEILELGAEICDPPCWYGVEPGLTTLAETKENISSLDFFTEDGQIGLNENYSVLTWYGGKGNNAHFTYRNGTIQIIQFYFKEGTSLGTIIERFGDPDGFILSEDDAAYFVTIFYPAKGAVFKAGQLYTKPLGENMSVFTGYYVPQTEQDTFLNQYVQLRNLIQPGFNLTSINYSRWEGLGICPEGLSSPEVCEQ